jgi:peptidoglycan hydrolase-like protein with peptidoglycan-binding domain
MSVVTYQRGDTTALSKNFTRDEFECQCGKCTAQMIDTELVDKLQRIRDVLGVPLKITSGYRCIPHNAAVKGSSGSKHRYGMAADWRTANRSINPVALGILAQAVGFGGIGIYWHSRGAFVHADTRGTKATWLCTTPGQYPSTTYQKFILPTIRRGCTGDANRAATKMLQRLLGLTPDGIFGEGTENALLKAQEAHGLAVDGICGPASWKAISGASKYL